MSGSGSKLVAAVPVKTGTCRSKRYRERVPRGVQVVPVDVDDVIFEGLCRRFKVGVDVSCGREYIGVLVHNFLKEVL